ncbi:FecR family protein [Brevundimonas naejangsanensis]|uniref:FecR family protein n=1 Tax=Brevundimonas naejangsanensis TaxID=588932 RepID=UPI00320B4DCB
MTIEADADIRRKEAADWFARLNQRKVSTTDVRAFSAWRADPANAAAFERLEAVWDAAETLGHTQEIAAFTEEARTRGSGASSPPRQRLVGVLKPAIAVGAVVLALGAGAIVWRVQQPTVYSTDVGEQRTVQLADGSRVILDTDSRVSVRFTKGRRAVTLESGQARFSVQGDADRPFQVRAGETEVVALGTRFDVRRLGDGARVLLVEGRVAVRDAAAPDRRWSLAPGQQVVTAAPSPRVAAVDLPAATSWTTGRLTFEGTPIAVAVAEVNRYTRQPIELRDERISSIRVSGAFDAGDIDGFVAALQDLYPLEARRAPDGHLILTAPG